ncbi:MAG TPA: ADOP family duplicated permease [Gemmatimonadaceae bacterium]|nr:ADOP family duplicated permease [Gemmatimonadaceae bacterium]
MIRHAVRRLLHARTFTAATIATLTLGIGGTVAVFTVVNGVLLQPLPFARADRLVDVSHTLVVSGLLHVDQSDATYLLYRRDNRTFTDVGAYRATAVNAASADDADAGQSAKRVPAMLATASTLRVLRARAERGRLLSERDDEIGAPPVAVISDALWRRDFGADPRILDRGIVVDGVRRQIVGVLPPDFEFPDRAPALWLPLQLDPANTRSAAFDYKVVGRLRDGASLATATADLDRILPHVPEVFPGRLSAGAITATHMHPVVRSLRDVVVGDVGRVLWVVLGAVALLLVLACANVANLFLARAELRQRELAVRSALGAAQGQLLLELMSEGIVVSAIGGALGLGLAAGGVRVLASLTAAAAIPRLGDVRIDATVCAATAAIAAACALIVSALPLLRLDGASLARALVSSGRAATGRSRNRARRLLVVAQVAMAVVIVFAAGLFARSFARLRAVNPGFAADRAVTFRVALPTVAYPTTADAAQLAVRALADLSALPGVQTAGVVTKLPLDEEARQDSAVFIEDRPLRKGEIPDLHEIDFATPGYFGAMGIPLLAGRLFAAPEPNGAPAQGPPEVVVSAAFAARYWPGGPAHAIGHRVRMTARDPWHTIVGVVGSTRGDGLDQPPSENVYCPLVTTNAAGAPWIPRDLAFVVRSSGSSAPATVPIERTMRAIDPGLPLYRLMPVRALLANATARTVFTILLLSIAAIVATAVGACGIYGVISYLVSLRTREIGVRLALGAQAGDVRRLVTRQAVVDAAAGVAIGVGAALLLSHVIGAAAPDAGAADPAPLGAAAAVLMVTAIAASWIPARRAARLDPAIALRSD